MSKKRVLIIIGLVIIFIVGCILLVYDSYRNSAANNTSSSAILPNSYSVVVTEKGQVFTGQLVVSSKKSALTSDQLNKYVGISLNNTGDFMIIMCPSGYQNTGATASSNVSVGHDPDLGTSADVNPNQQGTITISCAKK
jgi:hypothetical protein